MDTLLPHFPFLALEYLRGAFFYDWLQNVLYLRSSQAYDFNTLFVHSCGQAVSTPTPLFDKNERELILSCYR